VFGSIRVSRAIGHIVARRRCPDAPPEVLGRGTVVPRSTVAPPRTGAPRDAGRACRIRSGVLLKCASRPPLGLRRPDRAGHLGGPGHAGVAGGSGHAGVAGDPAGVAGDPAGAGHPARFGSAARCWTSPSPAPWRRHAAHGDAPCTRPRPAPAADRVRCSPGDRGSGRRGKKTVAVARPPARWPAPRCRRGSQRGQLHHEASPRSQPPLPTAPIGAATRSNAS
jgi:hypothetical protein